jgi:hypothetical protein
MAMLDLAGWVKEYAKPNYLWYAKRLSGNDTLANESHQAGPYIPKDVLFTVFRWLNKPDVENPRVAFDLYIDSHGDFRSVTAIWYNNKLRGGTRNEARITNFGGKQSALLDPENTGALAVFVFVPSEESEIATCRAWVCKGETDENFLEDFIGPVEPGHGRVWAMDEAKYANLFIRAENPCWLAIDQIPLPWLKSFPTGAEIIKKTIELRPATGLSPDKRLMNRRLCEYELFRSVEEAIELPRIRQGFNSIDEFIAQSQTVLQRRKARSGRSLELHILGIFIEEKLQEGLDFSYQPESEPRQRPDFLFPSELAYKDRQFPESRLRMLAVKTTCKDRWRQILTEANRVANKHLLTLQHGVSEHQFNEMTEAGVRLVVPAPLVSHYPKSVQPHLQSLESFINELRTLRSY